MNYKKSRATVYEVAGLAGVSPATVSRVFGSSGYPVSEETRRKVLEAAADLQYAPAQKGVARLNAQVAVVIPNLENPYYAALTTGLEYSLHLSGIHPLLVNTNGDLAEEKKLMQELSQQALSGMIIVPCSDDTNISGVARPKTKPWPLL